MTITKILHTLWTLPCPLLSCLVFFSARPYQISMLYYEHSNIWTYNVTILDCDTCTVYSCIYSFIYNFFCILYQINAALVSRRDINVHNLQNNYKTGWQMTKKNGHFTVICQINKWCGMEISTCLIVIWCFLNIVYGSCGKMYFKMFK